MKYKEMLKAMIVGKTVTFAVMSERVKMNGTIVAVRLVATKPDARGLRKIKPCAEIVGAERNQVFTVEGMHVYSADTPAEQIDKDIAAEQPQKRAKKFVKPTVEEVAAYCAERKNGIDPQQFIDHYEANGWMVGKNKMKDWKAAVRTWERMNIERKAPAPQPMYTEQISDFERSSFAALHSEVPA